VKREFLDCEDRLTKNNHGEKQFVYFTKMINNKFKDEERLATIAMVHGFSECSSTSWWEAAMMYTLNGFEVVMCDVKGFGLSSGPRAGGYVT
jgi:alpha-beta hydrolase superfamily lysophospholipase